MLKVRIVSTDYCLSKPIKELDDEYSKITGSKIYQVPIIRIFGSTPPGQKCCICLHKIYPYLYITTSIQPSSTYLFEFANSLNKAINNSLNFTDSYREHIFNIEILNGLSFYGFSVDKKIFLKIYLFNPLYIKKVADLLLSGAVMGNVFQPYESHIPYILQMFIDNNLFGMNFIIANIFKFRLPIPKTFISKNEAEDSFKEYSQNSSYSTNQKIWTLDTISSDMFINYDKETRSELEVDVLAENICNKLPINVMPNGNPGLKDLWLDEKRRCIEHNLSLNLTPPSSPERNELCFDEMINVAGMHEQLRIAIDLYHNNILNQLSNLQYKQDKINLSNSNINLINPSQNEKENYFLNSSQCSLDNTFLNLLMTINTSQNNNFGEDFDSIMSPIIDAYDLEDEEIHNSFEMSQQLFENDVDNLSWIVNNNNEKHLQNISKSEINHSQATLSIFGKNTESMINNFNKDTEALFLDNENLTPHNKLVDNSGLPSMVESRISNEIASPDLWDPELDENLLNKSTLDNSKDLNKLEEVYYDCFNNHELQKKHSNNIFELTNHGLINKFKNSQNDLKNSKELKIKIKNTNNDLKNSELLMIESNNLNSRNVDEYIINTNNFNVICDNKLIECTEKPNLCFTSPITKNIINSKEILIKNTNINPLKISPEFSEAMSPTNILSNNDSTNNDFSNSLEDKLFETFNDDLCEKSFKSDIEVNNIINYSNSVIDSSSGELEANNLTNSDNSVIIDHIIDNYISINKIHEMQNDEDFIGDIAQVDGPSDKKKTKFDIKNSKGSNNSCNSNNKSEVDMISKMSESSNNLKYEESLMKSLCTQKPYVKLTKLSLKHNQHEILKNCNDDKGHHLYTKSNELNKKCLHDCNTIRVNPSETICRLENFTSEFCSLDANIGYQKAIDSELSKISIDKNLFKNKSQQTNNLSDINNLFLYQPVVKLCRLNLPKIEELFSDEDKNIENKILNQSNIFLEKESHPVVVLEKFVNISKDEQNKINNKVPIIDYNMKEEFTIINDTLNLTSTLEKNVLPESLINCLNNKFIENPICEEKTQAKITTITLTQFNESNLIKDLPKSPKSKELNLSAFLDNNNYEKSCKISEDNSKLKEEFLPKYLKFPDTKYNYHNMETSGSKNNTSNKIIITPLELPPTRQQLINNMNVSKLHKDNEVNLYEINTNDNTGKISINILANSSIASSNNINHMDDLQINNVSDSITGATVGTPFSSAQRKKYFQTSTPVVITKKDNNINTLKSDFKTQFISSPILDLEMLNRDSDNMEVIGDLNDRINDYSVCEKDCLKFNKDINVSIANDTLTNTPKICKRKKFDNCRKPLTFSDVKNDDQIKLLDNSNLNSMVSCYKNRNAYLLESQDMLHVKNSHQNQNLTLMSMELFICTRADKHPDPQLDQIIAFFYCIAEDNKINSRVEMHEGILIQKCGDETIDLRKDGLSFVKFDRFDDELQLIQAIVDLVLSFDVDILIGYEIETMSWGYLMKRAAHLNIFLAGELSRIIDQPTKLRKEMLENYRTNNLHQDLYIPGRIILNLWRIIKHELPLNKFTFENIAFHVLHQRYPFYTYQTLTTWFLLKHHLFKYRVFEYYIKRNYCNFLLIDRLDLIGQTSEFARIYGIEFTEVLSRGSQFRVESMMLRLAKPQNFICVSPSVHQRTGMRPPECIPLNLEPVANMYLDPVVVLDFQSLYPSIMIAHNYCYSTCLGRVENLINAQDGPFPFGCTTLEVTPEILKTVIDDINICPNGVVFVKQYIRKGIISSMVEEILNTRLMVKKAMKNYKDDKALQKLLHARQLGLKLIANVTFGYTAANYSGRMPCIEVGDSIVRKARETLERAIALVTKNEKWDANVIYGDTDSLFVLLKGRSKSEAFKIGKEIADAVTNDNPKPIKLKLEKVYQPCMLLTKKRYFGYMYESEDQNVATLDVKGIETVRRDNCLLVNKIVEQTIRLLFDSRNVSLVKQYIQRQCKKLLDGKYNLHDFIFAKEYRGKYGYKNSACVPALQIARRNIAKDKCSEPLAGDRVPYVIVHGGPGAQKLIHLVHSPQDLLDSANQYLRINIPYYIYKQILPSLQRILLPLGINIEDWFTEIPRIIRSSPIHAENKNLQPAQISNYFFSMNCKYCNKVTNSGTCELCDSDPHNAIYEVIKRIHKIQKNSLENRSICERCVGYKDNVLECCSIDCPVYFRRFKCDNRTSQIPYLFKLANQHGCW